MTFRHKAEFSVKKNCSDSLKKPKLMVGFADIRKINASRFK